MCSAKSLHSDVGVEAGGAEAPSGLCCGALEKRVNMVWPDFMAGEAGHVLAKCEELCCFNLHFGAPLQAIFALDRDGSRGTVVVCAQQVYLGSGHTTASQYSATCYVEKVEDVRFVGFPCDGVV